MAAQVRSQLMAETGMLAGNKDRTSPYGTPKNLTSPLVQVRLHTLTMCASRRLQIDWGMCVCV